MSAFTLFLLFLFGPAHGITLRSLYAGIDTSSFAETLGRPTFDRTIATVGGEEIHPRRFGVYRPDEEDFPVVDQPRPASPYNQANYGGYPRRGLGGYLPQEALRSRPSIGWLLSGPGGLYGRHNLSAFRSPYYQRKTRKYSY